tara:strand:+ start:173 stop:658 length:486 start_codon:yes stop_codon:yes gene_type:complete
MQRVSNLDRAMGKLTNLPKMAIAMLRNSSRVELDSIMNAAIKYIEIIRRYDEPKPKVDKYMRKSWRIYQRLQRMKHYPQYFVDNRRNDPDRTYSTEEVLWSGTEHGYTHLRWDSKALMAVPKDGQHDNMWFRTTWPTWYNINSNLEDTDYWVFKGEYKKHE